MTTKSFTVDKLQVIVFPDRRAMGLAAAQDVAAKMRELQERQPEIRMIFASAPSQNEFLEALAVEPDLAWHKVTAFHMDEYIGLPDNAPQKFSRYLQDRLFSKVNPGRAHLIDSTNDIDAECSRYGRLLKQAPIDIVCLGIGENGHIAFNDPPVADFDDSEIIKLVELDLACRKQQVNDGCFPDLASVPKQALTLTIPTLMSGHSLFCIVPGATKRQAVQQTLQGPISTDCPASILRRHGNCRLYLDGESYPKKGY